MMYHLVDTLAVPGGVKMFLLLPAVQLGLCGLMTVLTANLGEVGYDIDLRVLLPRSTLKAPEREA